MLQKSSDRQQEEYSTTSTAADQENNVVDSPLSDNEGFELNAPSPKKRNGSRKRVISVPIGEGGDDGSRSRTEVYPPPDSWSWRKYGQKPIKGSPYPRGYYRCSSSKGCPARKQVERNRLEPTKILITYYCEHNHSLPTSTAKHHHHHPHTPAVSAASASSTVTNAPEKFDEEFAIFSKQPELDFSSLARELGWFSDVGSIMLDSPVLVGPAWIDADVALMLPIGEEDQSLFGDLGELPECSVVFRRSTVAAGVVADSACCGSTA